MEMIKQQQQLTILSQDSPGWEDMTTPRGMKAKLFVAIKNAPFVVRLGLFTPPQQQQQQQQQQQSASLDFNSIPVEAFLYYDDPSSNAGPHREVVLLKSKPLQYKATIGVDGTFVDVECRIKVLSSQHEDSNFRIKFRAIDSATGEAYQPEAFVLSGPIKVVSKPEQLQHTTRGSAYASTLKNQKVSGIYVEQVKRIHSSAKEQLQLMRRIVENREEELKRMGREDSIIDPERDFFPDGYQPPEKKERPVSRSKRRRRSRKQKGAEEEEEEDRTLPTGFQDPFDSAFFQFIAAFKGMNRQQRAEGVRREVKKLKKSSKEAMRHMVELMHSECLKVQKGDATGNNNNSNAAESDVEECRCPNCPHRKRVMELDMALFSNWG